MLSRRNELRQEEFNFLDELVFDTNVLGCQSGGFVNVLFSAHKYGRRIVSY